MLIIDKATKPNVCKLMFDELLTDAKHHVEHEKANSDVLYIADRNDVGIQQAKAIYRRVKHDLSLLMWPCNTLNMERILDKFDRLAGLRG